MAIFITFLVECWASCLKRHRRLCNVRFPTTHIIQHWKQRRSNRCDYAHLRCNAVSRQRCSSFGGAIPCPATADGAGQQRLAASWSESRGGEVSGRGWKPAIVSSGNWSTALGRRPLSSSSSSSSYSSYPPPRVRQSEGNPQPSRTPPVYSSILKWQTDWGRASNWVVRKILIKNFKNVWSRCQRLEWEKAETFFVPLGWARAAITWWDPLAQSRGWQSQRRWSDPRCSGIQSTERGRRGGDCWSSARGNWEASRTRSRSWEGRCWSTTRWSSCRRGRSVLGKRERAGGGSVRRERWRWRWRRMGTRRRWRPRRKVASQRVEFLSWCLTSAAPPLHLCLRPPQPPPHATT